MRSFNVHPSLVRPSGRNRSSCDGPAVSGSSSPRLGFGFVPYVLVEVERLVLMVYEDKILARVLSVVDRDSEPQVTDRAISRFRCQRTRSRASKGDQHLDILAGAKGSHFHQLQAHMAQRDSFFRLVFQVVGQSHAVGRRAPFGKAWTAKNGTLIRLCWSGLTPGMTGRSSFRYPTRYKSWSGSIS